MKIKQEKSVVMIFWLYDRYDRYDAETELRFFKALNRRYITIQLYRVAIRP